MTDGDGFREPGDVDALNDAILYIASQLWAAEERIRLLESLLARAEVLPEGAVDVFEPGTELAEALDARRERFVARLLDSLAGSTGRAHVYQE